MPRGEREPSAEPTVPRAEVLELERRSGVPPRISVLLLVVLGLLAAGLYLVDREVHDRESAAVGRCVDVANLAIDEARSSVDAMVEYVRPTLFAVGRPATRRTIYGLVADTALGKADRLTVAGGECGRVSVWWTHEDLRRRRADCVDVVAAQAARLESVAVDGRAAFGAEPPRRCR
jgi:hypothetical protein